MKKFAIFLPQFYETKENNKWWGKGFTEWVSVRNAKPLYKGHLQPKLPLEGYYNMLDKETMENQADLMHKYKIDGMVYYHYYFDGKLLLEKPAENLLKWKDIKEPFFFCWANHTWYKAVDGKKEVLIEQTYGDIKSWEKHFKYLLPFFKDSRYEKKDNKPIFMIFMPDFKEKEEMFSYFNKRCIEEGFDGIFIIETIKTIDGLTKDAYKFLRIPDTYVNLYERKRKYSIYRLFKKIRFILSTKGMTKYVLKYDGNKLIDLAIKTYKKDEKVFHGLFFEWDNTPRHKGRGYIIKPIDKAHFDKYMDTIKDDEYVFINAWNEWAEGMMLEPTKENGYKYLEWIRDWSDRNDL